MSHDRAFLNNLVTSTLIMMNDAVVKEFVGGYDDWYQLQQESDQNQNNNEKQKNNLKAKNSSDKTADAVKKLNVRQRKKLEEELEKIPDKIESLEAEYQELIKKMASSEFYNQSEDVLTDAANRLKRIETEISAIYQNWQDIEHQLKETE